MFGAASMSPCRYFTRVFFSVRGITSRHVDRWLVAGFDDVADLVANAACGESGGGGDEAASGERRIETRVHRLGTR